MRLSIAPTTASRQALHPEVATYVSNLAQNYLTQHRYVQAEPLHQPALEIWEKALRPDDPKIGDTLKEYAQPPRG